jgi:hypothetical protein
MLVAPDEQEMAVVRAPSTGLSTALRDELGAHGAVFTAQIAGKPVDISVILFPSSSRSAKRNRLTSRLSEVDLL